MSEPDEPTTPPPRDDLDFAAPIAPPVPGQSEAAPPAPEPALGTPPPASSPPEPPAAEAHADGAWEHVADPEDVRKHKGVAMLAYVFFFVPLVVAEKSPFARFHANQGLLVLCIGGGLTFGSIILAQIAGVVFGAIAGGLGGLFAGPLYLVAVAAWLASVTLTLVGMAHAFGGEMKELPLIGHYRIIK